jgi:hypothetical protein
MMEKRNEDVHGRIVITDIIHPAYEFDVIQIPGPVSQHHLVTASTDEQEVQIGMIGLRSTRNLENHALPLMLIVELTDVTDDDLAAVARL